MKKILAILLAVVMTLSMITPVFAASYSDTAENDYEAAIEHLSGLGVIAGYEDGSFQPEKIVTRAEMAKLLVVCLGLEQGATLLKGETQFADVDTNHWATGFINIAVAQGLIKGDGNGNFRPDDTVNYAEACTMCLRALGYGELVEKAGQWPANYLAKANALELFKDVELTETTVGANRGSIAQLIWNMVNTEMWDITSISETTGASSEKTGDTMFQTYFTKYCTKINNTSGDFFAKNYLNGQIVDTEVYDENTIAITIANIIDATTNPITTEDVTVLFKDVESIDLLNKGAEAEVIYYVDKDNNKIGASLYIDDSLIVAGIITKIDTANKKVWIDGVEYNTEATDTLKYDHDGNGSTPKVPYDKFTIIEVSLDKDTKKVEAVEIVYEATNDMIIKEIKTTSSNETKYVKETGTGDDVVIADDAKVIFLSLLTGKVYDKSEIKAGMSIDTDNITSGTKAFVLVSEDSVTGKVTKIDETNDVLTIEGKEYKLADDVRIKYEGKTNHEALNTTGKNSLIQQSITAKLNVKGEIVFIGAPDTIIADNYGFITKAWSEKVEGVDTFKVRIMGLDGKTADFETYNFDNEVKSSEELVTTDVGTLLKYELKDGKIVAREDDEINAGITKAQWLAKGGAFDEAAFDLIDTTDNDILTKAELVAAGKIGTVKIENKTAAAISSLNKTSKTFVQSTTIAYNDNTKFMEYVVKTADNKVEIGNFKSDDLDTAKTYIVIYDDSTNVADYVLYNSTSATGTLATKVYGVVVEPNIIVGNENNTKVYATTLFDIATNTEVELTTGDSITGLEKGNVVEYSVKADGRYNIEDADIVGTIYATYNEANDLKTVGDNYELKIDSSTKVLLTSDVNVIFVNVSGEVVTTNSLSDITATDNIYGAVKLDKVGVSDSAVYSTIIVVVG